MRECDYNACSHTLFVKLQNISMAENKEIYRERAVFVGVIKQGDDERQINEYLDELEFLAETAGAIGVKRFIQKVDRPELSVSTTFTSAS